MISLKRRAAQIDSDQQSLKKSYDRELNDNHLQISELSQQFEFLKETSDQLESECQILKFEKESLEKQMEDRDRVKL